MSAFLGGGGGGGGATDPYTTESGSGGTKLSEIAAAGSPPALTDQLVGVTGGTTDNLITPQQLAETFQAGGIVRTLLTSNATYYVSATGSDSNPGTSLLPWATLQHAVNFIAANIDTGGFILTINIAAGSYEGCGFKPVVGGGILYFLGGGPGSTTITAGPADGVYNGGECFSAYVNPYCSILLNEMTIDGSTVTAAGNLGAISVSGGSTIALMGPTGSGSVAIVGCPNNNNGTITVFNPGSFFLDTLVQGGGAVALSGSAAAYVFASDECCASIESNYTISGTPDFSGQGFIVSVDAAQIVVNATFSGSITGYPYGCAFGNIINFGADLPTGTFPGYLQGNGNYLTESSSFYYNPGAVLAPYRAMLLGSITIYVNPSSGSDSNPGTSSLPFATLTAAYNYVAQFFDGGGFNVTFSLSAGTFDNFAPLVGLLGFKNANFVGAGSGSTTLPTMKFGVSAGADLSFNLQAIFNLDSMTIADDGSGYCLENFAVGLVTFGAINGDLIFSPTSGTAAAVYAQGAGCQVFVYECTFTTGSWLTGFWSALAAVIQLGTNVGGAIKFTGTPTFASFLLVEDEGVIYISNTTFTGSVTSGLSGFGSTTGLIDLQGFGPANLPGAGGIYMLNGSRYEGPTTDIETPLTGATITMGTTFPDLILQPAGALLALTVILPPVPAIALDVPYLLEGQRVTISSSQTITTLTPSTSDGSSIGPGVPTTVTGKTAFALKYDFTTTTWDLTA